MILIGALAYLLAGACIAELALKGSKRRKQKFPGSVYLTLVTIWPIIMLLGLVRKMEGSDTEEN